MNPREVALSVCKTEGINSPHEWVCRIGVIWAPRASTGLVPNWQQPGGKRFQFSWGKKHIPTFRFLPFRSVDFAPNVRRKLSTLGLERRLQDGWNKTIMVTINQEDGALLFWQLLFTLQSLIGPPKVVADKKRVLTWHWQPWRWTRWPWLWCRLHWWLLALWCGCPAKAVFVRVVGLEQRLQDGWNKTIMVTINQKDGALLFWLLLFTQQNFSGPPIFVTCASTFLFFECWGATSLQSEIQINPKKSSCSRGWTCHILHPSGCRQKEGTYMALATLALNKMALTLMSTPLMAPGFVVWMSAPGPLQVAQLKRSNSQM